MADDRIDIVFGAAIDELVAGVQQVKDQLASLTEPVAALAARCSDAMGQIDTDLRQPAKNALSGWVQSFNLIQASFDTMLQGVLLGTQTWQQAMARVFSNLAVSFIEQVANMMLQWAAFTLVLPGIGVPFAAGAAGLGGVIGGGIIGFAGGAWSVPADMIAMVHAGEMILPANVAGNVRAGGGVGTGEAAPRFALNVSVQAMDAAGVAQWANANAKTLAATIARYMTSNPNSRGDY